MSLAPSFGRQQGAAAFAWTRGSALAAFAAALAWTALLRWPFRDYGNFDVGFFTTVSWLWLKGLPPYLYAFDVKPPGYFAALAVSEMVFGATPFAQQAIGALADAVTCLLLFQIARKMGAPRAGVFAAMLYPLFSQVGVANDGYSLLIALSTLGVALALSALRVPRAALLSGLALGAAGMVKQTAALDAAAALVILMFNPDLKGKRLRSAVEFGAGLAAFPLLTLAYFAEAGGLGLFFEDVVGTALRRPGAASDGATVIGGFSRLWLYLPNFAPALQIAPLTILLQRRLKLASFEALALSLWFLATLAGVVAQRAIMSCYVGPALPSALLLCGLGVAAIWPKESSLLRLAPWGAAALAAAELTRAFQVAAPRERVDYPALEAAAAVIQAAGPRRDDRLYVINAPPEAVWTYVLSDVLPVSRHLIPSQSLSAFPGVGPERIRESFALRPRFVVTSAHYKPEWHDLPGAREIAETGLTANYERLAEVGSGWDALDVYERRP